MTDQAPAIRPAAREVRVVEDVIPILDTARFEHLQRIAVAMAQGSLVPLSLRGKGTGNDFEPFSTETVVANLFRIVNQAVRWNADPFAVVDCASIVHGRLMWEGKLVHAIVESRVGVRLQYVFGRMVEVEQKSGAKVLMFDPTEEAPGELLAVQVVAQFDDEDCARTIEGTVKQWKTTGNNSPWGNPLNFKRQLRYRGAREWARAHSPGVLLGIVTTDEMDEDVERQVEITASRRAPREKVDLKAKLAGPKDGQAGFNADHVAAQTEETPHDPETGEVIEGTATEVVDPKAVRKQALAIAQQKGAAAKAARLVDDQAALDALTAGTITDEERSYILNGIAQAESELELTASARAEAEGDASAAADTSGAEVQDDEVADADGDTPTDEDLDLLRQNAYDDGYEGEPVQAILAECETDEEREIATVEHERGRQARIAKDAEEHAASEAAEAAKENEFDITQQAGPAPRDPAVTYLLASDEPGADNKVPTYRDGKQFSRVGPKGAKALIAYDGHAEPQDPTLASQSGGTGEVKPKPGGLYAELAAKDSWLAIKPELSKVYGTDDFKALTPEDQAQTRAHLWGAVMEMKDRTRDPVDWANDPSAFTLWADWLARQDDVDPKERADMIDGTFQTLQSSPLWTGKLPPAAQDTVTARVSAMLANLRGA